MYFKDGARQPGLAVADGYIVTKPILEALSKVAGADVPFIASTMVPLHSLDFVVVTGLAGLQAQEGGGHPTDNVTGLTETQFGAILAAKFDPKWGTGFGYRLAQEYALEIKEGVQKAYDTMAADQGMTCGNQDVVNAAARGFKSPTYSVYFEAHDDQVSH